MGVTSKAPPVLDRAHRSGMPCVPSVAGVFADAEGRSPRRSATYAPFLHPDGWPCLFPLHRSSRQCSGCWIKSPIDCRFKEVAPMGWASRPRLRLARALAGVAISSMPRPATAASGERHGLTPDVVAKSPAPARSARAPRWGSPPSARGATRDEDSVSSASRPAGSEPPGLFDPRRSPRISSSCFSRSCRIGAYSSSRPGAGARASILSASRCSSPGSRFRASSAIS